MELSKLFDYLVKEKRKIKYWNKKWHTLLYWLPQDLGPASSPL